MFFHSYLYLCDLNFNFKNASNKWLEIFSFHCLYLYIKYKTFKLNFRMVIYVNSCSFKDYFYNLDVINVL